MKEHLDRSEQFEKSLPRKIAVVRALPGLGDLLCFVPALRALRVAFPKAEITLIGLTETKSLVQRFGDYVDEWLEFPGYPGIPEVELLPQRVVSFLSHAQQLNLDLALQMHGNGSCTNGFTLLLGAKQSVGFFQPGQYCPDSNYFLPYPDREPEIWRNLRLLQLLGVPLRGDQMEFPLWQSDWQELEAIAATHNLNGNYVCVHPGASINSRRWSDHNFAVVADRLAAQGLQIVLTGTAAEAELTQSVAQAMQFPVVDLAGKTSLGAIAALLKKARLLICNDTGISHLAAALQVNSVVIFSNSDPQRWAPLDRQRHRVVGNEGYEVRGTRCGVQEFNPTSSTDAINRVCTVLAEAFDLLKQEVAYAS